MDEAVVATLDGEPLRADFPMRATVFGVACVVIPVTEYDRLARAVSAIRAGLIDPLQKSRSRIENDAEVAEFLVANLGHLHLYEAVEECRKRFGDERTPSRSAIDRFRKRLRGRR